MEVDTIYKASMHSRSSLRKGFIVSSAEVRKVLLLR